ncbi:hypothetical protein E1301_Tti004635 [Triplophysa tibetana]|uniref:BED-type domain-containing protein n=1 Tax=Triplophysa tibetana TaxID=1572043 RepID=A0A5A9N945_9TELE|nr:hypothetical protein E1301_Tti004635 [Triplophysa tibetana]
MTKLDRLHTFMTERLMEAVKEIILTVGRTVREYEEETERIRTENERLKDMLRASGCFPEQTNAALQTCQPVSPAQPKPIPTQKEELEYLEKIQQNQWQTHLEQQIKSEEPACSVNAYQESAALPLIVDNKDPYASDTNPAVDEDEITDFPKKIKVEINSLCSADDIRNTEDAYQSWSPHSPDLPFGTADFHRSQHPSQPTHTTNETPPTLSQHSSLSDGAHHLPYHNILCTNSSKCNSKCCEMQKRTIAKSSPVWKYFSLKQGDCSKAVCLMCKAVISRGRKEYTTSALLKHLRMKHGKC